MPTELSLYKVRDLLSASETRLLNIDHAFVSVEDDFRMSPESWLSLLAISSRFEFSSIISRALSELFSLSPPLPPILRISLARKHAESFPQGQCDQHILKAAKELVLRPQTLKPEEIDKIGSDVTARVARAREEFMWEVCRASTRDAPEWDDSVRYPTGYGYGVGGLEIRKWKKAVDEIVEHVFSDFRTKSAQL